MTVLLPIGRPAVGSAGSTEGATIDMPRLNLDSSGAYAVASHTAVKNRICSLRRSITLCAPMNAASLSGSSLFK